MTDAPTCALVVTAAAGTEALGTVLGSAVSAIEAAGGSTHGTRSLDGPCTRATLVEVQGLGLDAARSAVAPCAADDVDVNVVPGSALGPGPRLVVLDVDSTLIEDEVIELLADAAGTREEVAAVTERAMRGELDFAESLHARVATLAGLPTSVLHDARRRVRYTPGVGRLAATVRATGGTVAVVSGGFQEIVDQLLAPLAIDHAEANRLGTDGGQLTGTVAGAVVDADRKQAFLTELAEQLGIPQARTVAIGDGANDLRMIAAAGVGIAFCAKPVVREAAPCSLRTRRLDLVLALLGIGEDAVSDVPDPRA